MIGVVSAFMRGERLREVNSAGYKIYCRVWNFIYPLRSLLVRLKNTIRSKKK